jgi:hypothetical protein
MKFNGYGYILEVQQSLGNTSNIVLLNRKWKIQDGGHKIWKHVKRISRLVCEIEMKFKKLCITFVGPARKYFDYTVEPISCQPVM